MGQDGAKRGQDGPKMAQDGAKMAQEGARMARDGAKMAQEGARVAQDGAKISISVPISIRRIAPRVYVIVGADSLTSGWTLCPSVSRGVSRGRLRRMMLHLWP